MGDPPPSASPPLKGVEDNLGFHCLTRVASSTVFVYEPHHQHSHRLQPLSSISTEHRK